MFTLTYTIATGQQRIVETLRTHTPHLKRWGGRILIVIGTWLLTLGVFAHPFARLLSI